jgi:hypothetical protein
VRARFPYDWQSRHVALAEAALGLADEAEAGVTTVRVLMAIAVASRAFGKACILPPNSNQQPCGHLGTGLLDALVFPEPDLHQR